MDLTDSYVSHLPDNIKSRYEFIETRNAAAVIRTTNPVAFSHITEVLVGFSLHSSDLLTAGGNESRLAARLNAAFRDRGWREGRVDTRIELALHLLPYSPAGEHEPVVTKTETANKGYLVDNVRDRVALDVEWNAKDGNLDRDIAAYRALYDAGLIDGSVMITRTQEDLRNLGRRLAAEAGWDIKKARGILGTTTTTNIEKLRPRVTRGDAGGCPFLGVLICAATYGE